ncbi:hypothetical protein JCM8115_000120 [Rhodotorula mucilaginosa]|nr:hypothetical protein B0A53_01793 [Rhodotorula sp. CCFEE 5036]
MGSHSHGPVGYGTSLADHFASLGLHESVEPATDKQRAASFPPISTTVVSYPPSTAIASPPPASNYPYGLSRGPIGARGGHLRSDTSRPHSTDAYSSHSSGGRSWVLDSDASSVCSMASSNQGIASEGAAARSNARTGRSVVVYEDGSEEIFEEGGEVYRPESEGGDIDFLDQRSEPPETSLQVDRTDPSRVLLRVTLPGFSLDNITVAMRRGKKVHIVADSYGENGGHYERLVFLGSDVSSSAPRAEFDGTLLKIYVERRRPSRRSSSAAVADPRPSSRSSSLFSSPELDPAHQLPDWRASVASIWSSGSFSPPSPSLSMPASLQASSILAGPLSPPLAESLGGSSFQPATEEGLVGLTDLNDAELPPPCTARASPPPDGMRRAACVTGPEGARRAARAAREAASRRAREEAKLLDLRDGVTSSSSSSSSSDRGREPHRKRHVGSSPSDSTGGESDLGGSNTSSSGGEASWASISPTASTATDRSSDPITIEATGGTTTSVTSSSSVDRHRTVRGVYPYPANAAPRVSSSSNESAIREKKHLETGRVLDSATTRLEGEIAAGSDLKSAASAQDSGDKVVSHPGATEQSGSPTTFSSSPSRPKMPDSSPTFRASDHAASFSEAIAARYGSTGPTSPPASSDGENRTPRHEVPVLDFAVTGTPRNQR